jgi:glycosyltransferase involved in cell wall biosynthesis
MSAWELVVVDDGSTDETRRVAAEAAGDDSRIRIIDRPQEGIVAALQCGLESAQGELIARMDADDIAHPERLEAQSRCLREHPAMGVVGCRVAHGGDRRTSLGYALHVDWTNTLMSAEDIMRNRFVESPMVHPTVMFRRELLAKHGGYADGEFPEDYELWLRWMDAGVLFAKVPEELLIWNDPPQRLSRTDPRYSPDAFFRIKAKYLARELGRVAHGRPIWVWGAGRPTRKRAAHLAEHGVSIAGYIDIDPKKVGRSLGTVPVVRPENLPPPSAAFVLGYVSTRGARDLIRSALRTAGYAEANDFLMCA